MDAPLALRTPGSKALLVLSLVAATFAAASSLWGLLDPALYARDPAIIAPQLRGQDLVTLLLAVPALSMSAWLAHRGSARAVVAQYGLLVYFAYTYATYAFGARFNVLFLAYCAILSVSTYALFVATPRLLASARAIDPGRLPRRTLIGVQYGIVAIFTLLWGIDIVTAMMTGKPPLGAVEAETPTSFIHVLDLSFVLPLGAIAATLLVLRHDAGAPLTGVFLVKAMSIALAVLSMAIFTALAGQPVNFPVAASMGIVVLSVGLVGWRYVRAFPKPARNLAISLERPTA